MAVMKEWGERRNEDNGKIVHKQRFPRDSLIIFLISSFFFPGTSAPPGSTSISMLFTGEDTGARRNHSAPKDPHKPRSLPWIGFINRLKDMAMSNAFSAVLFACQTLIDQAESLSLLATERAALGQAGDTTGRLGEDVSAAGAHDNSLGVGEDSGDLDAALLYEKI